jgi:hypothetical protein
MRRFLAAVVGAAVLTGVAACGGGTEEGSGTTLPTLPPSSLATLPPSTTAAATSAPVAPTTVAGPAWPLTGVAGADAVRAALPALVVKIDNHPRARPQSGLGQADVVYEEIAEGVTRFFAVFHSTGSDPVGPIRSARTTDIDLLAQLNHPLFAYSGANRGTRNALKQADVAEDLGASTGSNLRQGGYFRDPARRSPHNLYATTTQLWSLTPDGAVPPPALFAYRGGGTPAAGSEAAAAVDVTMAATRVQWRWDAPSGRWMRSQDGEAQIDAAGRTIDAENVVDQFVEYRRSSADPISPEAVTVGEGDVWVFTGGGVIAGRWSRPDPARPAELTDASGREIRLAPGRTWVELARAGDATRISA